MISIVIPVKHERFLEKTISNIKKYQDNINEIIIIFDEDDPDFYAVDYPKDKLKTYLNIPRKGTSVSRDIGIELASYDCILQTDAHVLFNKKGFDTYLLEQHKKYPNDILCCKTVEVDDLFRRKKTSVVYSGANLILKKGRRTSNIFSMEWRKEKEVTTDEVSLVMGASYVFSKNRYINILKRPLSIGSGWGKDEVRLSIPNWICGGKSRVVDCEVLHNTNLIKWQEKYKCNNKWDYDFNSFALLELLPMSKDLKNELNLYMQRNWQKKENDQQVLDDLKKRIFKNTNLKKLYNYYKTFNKTLDDYVLEYNIKDNTPTKQATYDTASPYRHDKHYTKLEMKNGYIYKKQKDNIFDYQYCLATVERMGSHIFMNWLYSQFDGNTFVINQINNPRFRVDHKRLLKRTNLNNAFNYKPINTTDNKILLYSYRNINLNDPDFHTSLSFVESTINKSIILIRGINNWMSSYVTWHNKNQWSVNTDQAISLWIDFTTKAFENKNQYSEIVYFDKFISNQNYRNYLFNSLKLSHKNEKCLDKCLLYGGGSSFDGSTYKDKNAKQMDVLNRWKHFENTVWFKEIQNNKEIIDLNKKIEDLTIH